VSKNKQVPDFRRIFLLAEEHSTAADILKGRSTEGEEKTSSPRLMIDSFAVELYLKCLYVMDKDEAPPRLHNWVKLFEALEPHTREAIREDFYRMVDGDLVLRNLRSINPDAVKTTEFYRSLEAAGSTFDKHRYTFEPPPDGEWFYGHLLRQAIRNVTIMDIRLADLVSREANK
jgi:hypothetical protein